MSITNPKQPSAVVTWKDNKFSSENSTVKKEKNVIKRNRLNLDGTRGGSTLTDLMTTKNQTCLGLRD